MTTTPLSRGLSGLLATLLLAAVPACGGGSDTDKLECSKDDPTCKCVEAGKSMDCK